MVNRIAIRYGIMAGVGTIAYLLLFYFLDPRWMLRGSVIWSTYVIYVLMMYRATTVARENTDHFPFQAALRPSFLVFVLATLIYYVFYYLMFNVFDPNLLTIQHELLIENAQRFADITGDERLGEQIRRLSVEDIRVTWSNVALGAGRSILFGFGLSLILAGILRRD